MPLSRDSEIRHLAAADIIKLSQILDQTESWKKLMRIIPKTINNDDTIIDSTSATTSQIGKYNTNHIRLIENASNKQNRLAAEILFEEWGTSGKIRPKMKHLLILLIKAELFRAADYVSVNILSEKPPERPSHGPAAKIDISLPDDPTFNKQQIENILSDIEYPLSASLIENNTSIANNNKDFYNKRGIDGIKKIEIITSSVPTTSASSSSSSSSPSKQQSNLITFSISGSNNLSSINNRNNSNNNNQIHLNGTQINLPEMVTDRVTETPTTASDLIKFSSSTLLSDNNSLINRNNQLNIKQVQTPTYESDLIKFSSSTVDDSLAIIPEISELMNSKNNDCNNNNNNINTNNTLNSEIEDDDDDDDDNDNDNNESVISIQKSNQISNIDFKFHTQLDSSALPNISLLNNKDNNNYNSESFNIPNISGLNLGTSIKDQRNTISNTSISISETNITESYESFDSGSYIIPTDDEHQSQSDIIPNLSILNKIEIKNTNDNGEHLESTNSMNIPCLSALRN